MWTPSPVGRAEGWTNTYVMNARHASDEFPADQLFGCDDEYEFSFCSRVDRNHLLVLDHQALAGAHLHSADLQLACCRRQITGISFAEGEARRRAGLKQSPVYFRIGANSQCTFGVATAGEGDEDS